MLGEILHATISVGLLTIVIAVVFLNFTDVPVGPFLFGEGLGLSSGITVLVLTSPRGRRR